MTVDVKTHNFSVVADGRRAAWFPVEHGAAFVKIRWSVFTLTDTALSHKQTAAKFNWVFLSLDVQI